MDQVKVTKAAEQFTAQLQPLLSSKVIVSGPAPAPLEKAKGQFRHQIILRAPTTRAITDSLKVVAREFHWPSGVSMVIDVDAVSLM